MLDAKLLDEAGWEDARRERATEDGRELRVESSDAHVLELKVGREDRVRRCPVSSVRGPAPARTYFFALDLILIALAGSLRKLTSLSLVRMPIRPPLEPSPFRERFMTPLTVALRFCPW